MNKGVFFLRCVVVGLLAVFAVGFVTMLLWNWLIPTLFNGPVITYWQALGLLLLSKILFWGFGKKTHHDHKTPYWKKRFQDKFSSLDPADREAFKQKMKEKWCRWEQQSDASENPTVKD